jgi:hypothetical protein
VSISIFPLGEIQTKKTMKLHLFTLIFLLSSILCYSQQELAQKSLPGTYQFFNDDSLFRLTVILKRDHSFIYDRANDLTKKSSVGSWSLSRDTLVLNSRNKINRFKIKVKEAEALGELIKFGDVRTRNGTLIPTALIAINGDTTKLYDPLDTNYTLHPGDIKTLNLFIGRARSELYPIKNPRANRIDVTLDMEQSPTDYVFMENAKFLVAQTSIFPLTGTQMDSITVDMNKKVPIRLIKIK